MTELHIPAIAELERLAFSSPWSEDALRAELSNPRAVFLVAEPDRGGTGPASGMQPQAAGYVGMHHLFEDGYITNIVVHPDFRRRGIAAALLHALAEYGRQHGLSRITLEVRVSNAAAISLYQKLGFVEQGRRKNFYDRPVEDGLIYSLFIKQTDE